MTVEIRWRPRARLTSRRFELRVGGAVLRYASTEDEAQAIARQLKSAEGTTPRRARTECPL